MNLDTYRQLRAQARRLARNASDAEDLVQETLLAAVVAERADLPWLSGTLRNLAAMQARAAVRRRRRESHSATVVASATENVMVTHAREASAYAHAWLQELLPSLRRVAVLALHGLSAEEIRWILQLSPDAFRQRLSRLRKALEKLAPDRRGELWALACLRDPERAVTLQFGRVRKALMAALAGQPGLASHDTDGHLLVIRGRGHGWPSDGNE